MASQKFEKQQSTFGAAAIATSNVQTAIDNALNESMAYTDQQTGLLETRALTSKEIDIAFGFASERT